MPPPISDISDIRYALIWSISSRLVSSRLRLRLCSFFAYFDVFSLSVCLGQSVIFIVVNVSSIVIIRFPVTSCVSRVSLVLRALFLLYETTV